MRLCAREPGQVDALAHVGGHVVLIGGVGAGSRVAHGGAVAFGLRHRASLHRRRPNSRYPNRQACRRYWHPQQPSHSPRGSRPQNLRTAGSRSEGSVLRATRSRVTTGDSADASSASCERPDRKTGWETRQTVCGGDGVTWSHSFRWLFSTYDAPLSGRGGVVTVAAPKRAERGTESDKCGGASRSRPADESRNGCARVEQFPRIPNRCLSLY